MKFNHYRNNFLNTYFWRTHTRQEIDYIEEYGGHMYAYDFKWGVSRKVRFPEIFMKTYSVKKVSVITRENFEEFM